MTKKFRKVTDMLSGHDDIHPKYSGLRKILINKSFNKVFKSLKKC